MIPVRRAVGPQEGSLVHPETHRLRRHRQEVDLRAIVGGEVPRRLRAPVQPQVREHESGRRVGGAAPRPLEVAEPGHLHCVEVWRAFPSQASTTCL